MYKSRFELFATKYSLCSIFRDLQDLQTFAPLQIQNVRDFSIFRKNLQFFRDFCKILRNFVIFRSDFHGNLPEFHRISAILILQLQNFRKIIIQKCQNPEKMQQKVHIFGWQAVSKKTPPPRRVISPPIKQPSILKDAAWPAWHADAIGVEDEAVAKLRALHAAMPDNQC